MQAVPGQPDEAAETPLVLAPLLRRTLSLIYETLLLAALLWCAALLFGALENKVGSTHVRTVFQAYLLVLTGVYFVWQWTHGGQTLPMKTWHMRLVTPTGQPVGTLQAWARYLIATAGVLGFGLGFLWALIDRDRQFLHDRLSRTRLVRCPRVSAFPGATSER